MSFLTKYLMIINEATEMVNPNLSIKFAVGISLFANALLSLGTERHFKYYNDVWSGRQCSHALLFAQLIVEDVCHGLHGFVVPIRDPETLTPYPNIDVGDLGEKAGLNGIDNGYIMFYNYRIPRENLLNRIGDINSDGEYETSYRDPQRLLGAALESLSAGRVALIQESCNSLIKSVVIAVRYAAQRLQFSDDNGIELPIIEYQTHQWRIFPFVAASYIMKCYVRELSDIYIECVAKSRSGEMDMKQTSQMVSGVHSLVCCTKALVTWTSQRAIQECREACGGHGYHKAAGFGDMRNNHDPRVTFEGDNNVLLQQTSNWLLRIFSDSDIDFSVYPNTNLNFMANYKQVLARKFQNDDFTINLDNFIMHTYKWLICWLAKATKEKMEKLKAFEMDRFKIRNLCQVYKARSLSLVFSEYNIINHFQEKLLSCDSDLKPVLIKVWKLYSLWSIYNHLSLLYQGGYSNSSNLSEYVSEGIIHLCEELKPEMVALVDSISPPDFVLNSVLGYSDGKGNFVGGEGKAT
uniref:Acyl-coenzyme A oxidase n=1 Tax=Rhodnius prolixus TaxID=13249 RepID=T1HBE6_RHOPR